MIMRKADNSIREERAGTSRLALICAETPDVSPVARGGKSYVLRPRRVRALSCWALRRAMQLTSGLVTSRLLATSSFLALATTLWLGGAVQAQETQIIHPGSMAVIGFSGSVIPDFEEGLPSGVYPSMKPLSTQRAQPCASLTFQGWAGRLRRRHLAARNPHRHVRRRCGRSSRAAASCCRRHLHGRPVRHRERWWSGHDLEDRPASPAK